MKNPPSLRNWLLIFISGFFGSILTILTIVAFEEIIHLVWQEYLSVNPTSPTRSFVAPFMIVFAGILVTIISKLYGPTSGGLDKIIEHLNTKGSIPWREVPKTMLISIISISSGAPLGPEAPATEASAGVASWIGEKTNTTTKTTKLMGIASVVGMLIGFAVFTIYTGGFGMPLSDNFEISTLPFTPIYGIIAAIAGILVGIAAKVIPVKKPIIAGLIVAILVFIFPSIMFSGQFLIPDLITYAPSIPVLLLITVALVKIFSTSLLLKTGYFGGPIFPSLFAATAIGLGFASMFGHSQPAAVAASLAGLFTITLRQPIAAGLLAIAVTNIYAIPAVILGTIGAILAQKAERFLVKKL